MSYWHSHNRTRESWKPITVKHTEEQLKLIDQAREASRSGDEESYWRPPMKPRGEFIREAALNEARKVLKAAGWKEDGRGGFVPPKPKK